MRGVMSLRPEALTWTGLLAQWLNFAQAAVAIPKEADGDRWRASVPSIINLQAITFALADLGRLAPDERALALDKARLLIDEHAARLGAVWDGRLLSPALGEMIGDVEAAHAAAKTGGGLQTAPGE